MLEGFVKTCVFLLLVCAFFMTMLVTNYLVGRLF